MEGNHPRAIITTGPDPPHGFYSGDVIWGEEFSVKNFQQYGTVGNLSLWDCLGIRAHKTANFSQSLVFFLMYYIDTGRTDFCYPHDSAQTEKLRRDFEAVWEQRKLVEDYFPDGSITLTIDRPFKRKRPSGAEEADGKVGEVGAKRKKKM
jgi:hypothetical protein